MSGSSIPEITEFTQGDIVISVVGDGADDGSYADNQASPIVLEEIDPTTGAIVGQMELPQTSTTTNGVTENAISGEYGSSSEGALQLSGDGHSLVIAGYGVNANTYNTGESGSNNVYGNVALGQSTSVPGGPYTVVPRVIADISYNGTVDTSTSLVNVFNTNNPRSVATINGSSFYISGQGVKGDTTQGVFYAKDGAGSATSIDDATDTRTVEIYNGQLYVSQDSKQPSDGGTSNISVFGNTLPTSTTAPQVLPGISQSITLGTGEGNTVNAGAVGTTVDLSPEAYFFANSTTLYVADGGNPKQGTIGDGGLQKWTLNTATNTWQLDYTLSQGLSLIDNPNVSSNTSGTTGLIGLTGVVNGDGTVTLYATNATIGDTDQTYLYTITDTLSNTTAPSGEDFTALETAAADTNIRGVAFAPTAGTPTDTTISAGQTTSAGFEVTSGSVLTVLPGGTAAGVTVLAFGSAVISGTDSGSTIMSGGTETVSGSVTSDTVYGGMTVSGTDADSTISAGGTETVLGSVTSDTVYGGMTVSGTDSGSTISAGGTETLYGSANGDSIYGTQNVSGATAAISNETVYNGGVINLTSAGEIATGITVNSGGQMILNGHIVASNTVIDGGTVILESAKATLSGSVTFDGSGGILEVTGGVSTSGYGDLAPISGFVAGDEILATAITAATLTSSTSGGNTIETISGTGGSESFIFSGTAYPAGYFVLSNTGTGAELVVSGSITSSGGTVTTISSGQTTPPNFVVSGGNTLDVLAGGSAVGVTVLNSGTANISGTDSGSTISSGGTETVFGSASGDKIAGTMVVSGTDSGSTVSVTGTETVYGSAAGDTVQGMQNISGGTASISNETVNNGGVINLTSKGETATDITVGAGGSMTLNGNIYASGTVIDGGTVILESPKATLVDGVTFTGGGVLEVSDVSSNTYGDQAVISGFVAGDEILVTPITSATLTSSTSGGNTIETITGTGGSESFIFSGTSYSAGYFVVSNTAAGAALVVSGYTIPAVSTVTTISVGQATPPFFVVSSGNTLNVLAGGTAAGVTVLNGGTANISGTDTGSTIFAGGVENVGSTGVITGDFVEGELSAGTTASGAVLTGETVMNGGYIDIEIKGVTASNTVLDNGGTLSINGNSAVDDMVINGGTLVLKSPKANFSGVTFTGVGEIQITDLSSSGPAYGDIDAISGFHAGDVIDVTVIGTGASLSTSFADDVTTVTLTGSEGSQTFLFAGSYSSGFFDLTTSGSDAQITTDQCYCAGTRILTTAGEIAVEEIEAGDEVVTASGERKTVLWVGSWKTDLDRAEGGRKIIPVRIAAGALGKNIPHRDLYVSPDHSLFLDGALVPAYLLVNGSTVTQPARGGVVEYFHVQVEPHDILVAEGAAAESFLDLGATPFSKPGEEPKSWEDACAPILLAGPQLTRIRDRLAGYARRRHGALVQG